MSRSNRVPRFCGDCQVRLALTRSHVRVRLPRIDTSWNHYVSTV